MSKARTRSNTSGRKTGTSKNRSRTKAGSAAFEIQRMFTGTYFGKLFLVVLVSAAVVLTTLLATGNRLNLFFLVFGIEIIAAAIIGWMLYLIRQDPA